MASRNLLINKIKSVIIKVGHEEYSLSGCIHCNPVNDPMDHAPGGTLQALIAVTQRIKVNISCYIFMQFYF